MSNHSLTARGTDPPITHKSMSRILFAGEHLFVGSYIICRSRGGLSANEKKGKIHRIMIIIIVNDGLPSHNELSVQNAAPIH